jgi:hypothetical protein
MIQREQTRSPSRLQHAAMKVSNPYHDSTIRWHARQQLTSLSVTCVKFPWSDTDTDIDTGRLESGLKLSRLVAGDSGIDSTPDARCGRTGR